MEIREAIYRRQSIRAFTPEPAINQLLSAGRRRQSAE